MLPVHNGSSGGRDDGTPGINGPVPAIAGRLSSWRVGLGTQ